jgi:hypothetical protein
MMNNAQIKRLQTVTSQKWIEWKTNTEIAGSLTFSVTEIGDKVFVHASNTDTTEWYQKQVIVQMLIGSKGGLNEIKVL